MEKPKESILPSNDVLFFYDNVVAKNDVDIKGTPFVTSLSQKLPQPIFIEYKNAEEYGNEEYLNKILIFDSSNNSRNRKFFQHLRNAFCHKLIEIDNDRCKLLDWNAFKNGKHLPYSLKRITMIGDVDYESLKELINTFFLKQLK